MALLAQSFSPQARKNLALPEGLFDFTCSHEVAHQWWQAVVGSDPRGAPWIDESLAQASAVLVAEDKKGGSEVGRAAGEDAQSSFVALNYQGMRMANVPDGVV